jgi:hypothetical protein
LVAAERLRRELSPLLAQLIQVTPTRLKPVPRQVSRRAAGGDVQTFTDRVIDVGLAAVAAGAAF